MATSGIPLHCNICPRKPNFSDVSHLLTHVASKGHLSHYYKVKVRSGTEEASRRLIEEYDQWYAEWRVEDLMSERMNQKEKRRTRSRPSARNASAPRASSVSQRLPRPRSALSNILDPRLPGQPTVKIEHSATPTPPPPMETRQRTFAPRMQLWPTTSRSTSHSYTNPDYETSSEYSDPSERRIRRYTAQDSCAIEDDPADSIEDTTVSECTKLKGVYWPGMDLFDSATPEMRRKRNQKKDISVVEQLETNSQEVEPTELVFTPQGSFKKQRRISGSMYDDSSPIKVDSSPNRPFMTRPVLADLDPNRTRRTRQNVRPSAFPFLSRSGYADEQGQLDYGYAAYDQRRKRAFDVFQDNEATFEHPAAFSYLTSEYHHPQPSPTPAFASYSKGYTHPYTYDNKENILPIYQQQQYEPNDHGTYTFPAYYHGLGHDHNTFYHNPLYVDPYQQHIEEAADDQRTLTAPPSPSTG